MGESRHLRNDSRGRRQTHRSKERSADGSPADARYQRVRNRGFTAAESQGRAQGDRGSRHAKVDGEAVTQSGAGALAGLRVLDLTGHRAQFCARLLGDMGADVIKVEPPSGDDARRIGPFYNDLPHHDRSLFFWFYNLNKRSLTLDLAHPRGRELALALARSVDLVVESFAPGEIATLGLGWDALHRANPALILLSIAPFGQTGAYRDFSADDTVITAMGGMLYVNGSPGRSPVRPLGLQAYHSASYYGAIAAMTAVLGRDFSGEGQWIDLSMQEATASAVEHVAGR